MVDPLRSSGCRGAFGGGLRHPVPNLRFSFRPEAPRPFAALSFELRNKVFVVQREDAELTFAQVVIRDESGDVGEKVCHNGNLMGEISPAVNSHWGIFRESHRDLSPCDNAIMRDIQEIRAAILRAMAEKGFSRRRLSAEAGLSESAVRDILTRTQSPGIAALQKIANALEVPIDEITGANDDADDWQPREGTIRLAVEAWSLSLSEPRTTESDLRLLSHAVNEVLLFVARDPAKQDSPDFPAVVEAIVATAIRNYRPQPEQAA